MAPTTRTGRDADCRRDGAQHPLAMSLHVPSPDRDVGANDRGEEPRGNECNHDRLAESSERHADAEIERRDANGNGERDQYAAGPSVKRRISRHAAAATAALEPGRETFRTGECARVLRRDDFRTVHRNGLAPRPAAASVHRQDTAHRESIDATARVARRQRTERATASRQTRCRGRRVQSVPARARLRSR